MAPGGRRGKIHKMRVLKYVKTEWSDASLLHQAQTKAKAKAAGKQGAQNSEETKAGNEGPKVPPLPPATTRGKRRGKQPQITRGADRSKPELRPTKEDIETLPDQIVAELIIENWTEMLERGGDFEEINMLPHNVPPLFNFKQPVKLFRLLMPGEVGKDDEIEGITTATLSSGLAGSTRGFQCMGYSIPTISYLIDGARFWIIIKRCGNEKLEKLISYMGRRRCQAGCLNDQSLIIPPNILKRYGIEFETEIQREHDSILILPGVYYAWVNLIDETTVCKVHFATQQWLEYAREEDKYRVICNHIHKFVLNWTKIDTYQSIQKRVFVKMTTNSDSPSSPSPTEEESTNSNSVSLSVNADDVGDDEAYEIESELDDVDVVTVDMQNFKMNRDSD